MEQFLTIFSEYLNNPGVVMTIAVLTALSFILFIFLMVLWCIVPFAIFGTKKRLRDIIGETQKTNEWLEELVKETQKMNTWLAEIMSESKRTTAWLAEMKSEPVPGEAPSGSTEDQTAAPNEKRRHPRLEFQCTGMVMGKEAVVTDISMGGIFLELDEIPEMLKIGRVTNVDLDLPTEPESVRIKIKIVNRNEKGVGAKYIDLSKENIQAINNCFDAFKNTLPIRESDDP
jgi:hypothetical protein